MRTKLLGVFCGLALVAHPIFGQQPSDHAALTAKILELRASLNTIEAAFLSPSAQDCLDYASYLNTPNRGLIRLLPGEKYDQSKYLTLRGGGSYYSFFNLTQEYNFGSDIQLRDGNFKVGFAGMDYGFFAAVSEQRLEDISVDSPSIAGLSAYAVPSSTSEAQRDSSRSRTGLALGGTTYSDQIKAVANQTYILRSINYDQSDVLVAFRVVREDTDGSLIIIWKMLKKNARSR